MVHQVEFIEDVPFQHQLDPSLLTSANAHWYLDQICFPGSCILEQNLAWLYVLQGRCISKDIFAVKIYILFTVTYLL